MQNLMMESRSKQVKEVATKDYLSKLGIAPKELLGSSEIKKLEGNANEKELSRSKEMETLLLPRTIGIIETKSPAFLEIIKTEDQTQHLVITSFNPLKNYNEVKSIPFVNRMFEKSHKPATMEIKSLTKSVTWPNDINKVPKEMFGKEGFLVSGGFMVWPYNTGEVAFIDIKTGEKEKLTIDKKGWFYHKAVPFEMNGNPGILTARSNKNSMSLKKCDGELVWLEKPSKAGQPWKENVLINGPDVNFDIADINGDGKKEIVAAEFFNNKLLVMWEDGGKLVKREIEKDFKMPFDVEFVDLNKDGKLEILATNHEHKGSVFAYEVPSDLKNGEWKKHEIASNIESMSKMPGQGAPGKAIPFYPNKDMGGKPYVMLSGDGSGKVHLLSPKKPNDPNNWEYNESIIYKGDCTIGKIKIETNKDGYAQIFVPLYEKNKILVFEYDEKCGFKKTSEEKRRK